MVCSILATDAFASLLAVAPASIRSITVAASAPSVPITSAISLVALRVSPAKLFTSLATTAKVRPASARAHRLDGGIQGQDVGSLGNLLDVLRTALHLVHRRGEAGDMRRQRTDQIEPIG